MMEGYEPETVRVFNAVLKEGDEVIVCGAHQGYFVGVCSDLVGKTGRVFGYEPEPTNFRMLKDSCGDLDNVNLFNFALGDRKAKARFFVNSDNDGGHALWDVGKNIANTKTRENPTVIPVEVNTIDDLFSDRDSSKLKLLMLDAEGSEPYIIQGGINTIVDNDIPYIICEINSFALIGAGTSQEILRDLLLVNGYTGYYMDLDKVVEVPTRYINVEIDGEPIVYNMLFSRRGMV